MTWTFKIGCCWEYWFWGIAPDSATRWILTKSPHCDGINLCSWIANPGELVKIHIRLKKKNTLSQSLREFFKPTRHAVFYFLFYFFLLQLAFASTHIQNQKWLKDSTFLFSEIKRDYTRFLSSHVLKFFQNSKLSSFFVVKMKKKGNFKKKNESLNFAKSNAHRKTNAGGSFETQNFFF